MDYTNSVLRARNGDLTAYSDLVKHFQDMALGYAYAILGDFHLAQDAVQEAFLEGFRDIANIRKPVAFPTWLRRIVFKYCHRVLRRKRLPTEPLEVAQNVASTEKSVETMLVETEMKTHVQSALQSLPDEERTVTTLFYISEYPQRDIAEFLEIPLHTVKDRLRSARRRLKTALSPERMIPTMKETLQKNALSRDDSFATAVEICNAAQSGNLERVRQILAVKPELAIQDLASNNEHQPIHFAAEEGHAEVVRVLLETGADPLKGIYPHRTVTSALGMAEDRGHTTVVEAINTWLKEKRGTTPVGEEFVRAASDGAVDHLRTMLDSDGSLINATNKGGQTALFKAVQRGNLRLALELLDRGAAVDHRDSGGRRPIYYALAHSWKASDEMYKTYAIMAGALVACGAEYDLWVACGIGDVASVREMLADAKEPGSGFKSQVPFWEDHENPLVVACFHGHTEVVRALLDAGADPDAPFTIDVADEKVEQWGHPLWLAANRGHYDTVKLLLERGAKANTAVYASGNAVCWAYQYGHRRISDLMFQYGAVADLLSYCLTNNLAAISEIMHRELGTTSEESGDTRSPWERLLWSAILAGNVNVVSECLRRKPKYSDGEWFNLLEQSVRGWRLGDLKIDNEGFDRRNYIEILEMLLEYGADPNLRNPRDERFDFTILHHLAAKSCNPNMYGHTTEDVIEFAKLLLDHGADINALESKLKSTPLGWAARFGNRTLVEFLLSRRADPNLADAPWAKPLAWAENKGHPEIAELLRQHGARLDD